MRIRFVDTEGAKYVNLNDVLQTLDQILKEEKREAAREVLLRFKVALQVVFAE